MIGALLALGVACVWLAGAPSFAPTKAMPPLLPPRPTFTPTSAPPPRPTFTPTSVLPPRPTATPTSVLPPRPSLTPTPTPPSQPTTPLVASPQLPASASCGAHIGLRVLLPQTWPRTKVDWRDLWTVVQWQDLLGQWHDVRGWRGALDVAVIDEDGLLVGSKVWWVDKAGLGKGPLRWQVYQGKEGEGKLLVTSGAFYLPNSGERDQWIEAMLP